MPPALLPTAAWQVLAAWLAIGTTALGLGALVRRTLGRPVASADDWLAGFWLGFVATVVVLQLWQLAAPVDAAAACLVAALGAVGLATDARPALALVGGMRRRPAAVVALAVAAAWLALQALGGPRNGDSGLYHVPTMRWLLTHRLPPGLGNLAAPLAYNQSYFLWAALLDVAPLPGRATHVANGVLVIALLARILLGLSRVVGRRPCAPADAFYGALLPAVLPLGLDINLTSPSPDVAVYGLGIVLAGELVRFLTTGRRFADLAALALLAACAPPMKLSLGGLAVATAAVAGMAWVRRGRAHEVGMARVAAVLAAIAVLAPGVWMLRGVVASGHPLYPSALFGVPVAWAVPRESVVAEAKLIRYWNGVEGWWVAAWRDPRWLVAWLPTLDWLRADVLAPLAVAALAGAAGIARAAIRPRTPRALPPVVVVPTVASIAYCIAAAPRARYGASAYWVLAVQALWVAMPATVLDATGVRVRRSVALLAVGAAAVFVAATPGPLVPSLPAFEPDVRPTVAERRLASGLLVYDPGPSMQCWDAPLPCTPFPNEALRLRVPGDLGSGFTVSPMR